MFLKSLPSFICFAIIISLIAVNNGELLKRQKRSRADPEVLRKLTTDIEILRDESSRNTQHYEDLQGFLTAIGIGSSQLPENPCGSDSESGEGLSSWILLTSAICIKVMNGLHTKENAQDICQQEFKRNEDIDYPRVFVADSQDKNAALVSVLQTMPSVTAVWVESIWNFTNWAVGSPSLIRGRDCIEIRNDLASRGLWVDVSCSRMNSLICEKTAALPYSQVVQKVLQNSVGDAVGNRILEVERRNEEFAVKFQRLESQQGEIIRAVSGILNKTKIDENVMRRIEIRFNAIDAKLNERAAATTTTTTPPRSHANFQYFQQPYYPTYPSFEATAPPPQPLGTSRTLILKGSEDLATSTANANSLPDN